MTTDLAERIEVACRAHVERDDVEPAEARRWFATRLYVALRTVERWCDGSRKFQGPALACLEMLERGSADCPYNARGPLEASSHPTQAEKAP